MRPRSSPGTCGTRRATRQLEASQSRRTALVCEILEEAADAALANGFAGQAPLHRANLARVQQRAGDRTALTSYRQAVAEAVAVGDSRLAASTRMQLARLHHAHGEDDEAADLLEANRRWYATAGGGDFALLNEALAAAVHLCHDELTAILDRGRASGNVEVVVHCLDALARLAATTGGTAEARTLITEADARAATIAHLIDPAGRADATDARHRLGTAG
jgi:hypothetical protein